MANLIDETYFQQRLISIPQLNDAANKKRLADYIEMHEPVYLESVFGYEMSRDFLAGIGDNDRWDDILKGSEFVDCAGRVQKWKGFNNVLKESPIAYYVYFHKVREGDILLATTGNIKTKNENSNRISGFINLVHAYNYMSEYNRVLMSFIESKPDVYTNYYPVNTLTDKINQFGI